LKINSIDLKFAFVSNSIGSVPERSLSLLIEGTVIAIEKCIIYYPYVFMLLDVTKMRTMQLYRDTKISQQIYRKKE